MEALSVTGLSVTYREQDGELHALGPVSFRVDRGDFLCVLGPTGCGKTTLLRTLAGLEAPDDGRISMMAGRRGGVPVVGYVFQQGALFPWMTVRSNLEFPLRAAGMDKARRHGEVARLLDMVGLSSFAGSYPHQLSGGMQQRAALARALVMGPDLLLLDEPFSSLDTRTSQELQNSLRELWKESSTTVVFVTHNIEEAVYLAEKVIVLGHRPGTVVRRETIHLPDPRSRLSGPFTDCLVSLRQTFESLVLGGHQSSTNS